jgi:predicted nucleic acid-binding protein
MPGAGTTKPRPHITCDSRGFGTEPFVRGSLAKARLVERALRRFATVPVLNSDLAVKAAANYRSLRAKGITIRKSVDVIIGTFCIERGHILLHDDRDFEPMVRFLGLQVV